MNRSASIPGKAAVPDIRIRAATVDDLETINAFYNYHVPRSTCTSKFDRWLDVVFMERLPP